MQPHRSNALDVAAAALTVTLRRGVVEGSVTVMVLVSSARPPSTQGRAFERLHSRSAVL